VALFFVSIYVRRGYRYPVGWDTTYYVWRTRSVASDGLALTGTIRAGTPLLLAELLRTTGQNAWTLVAVISSIMAGLAGVAAAAMPGLALGMAPLWMPLVGLITWLAFGWNGMMSGHVDNVVNAALILSGLCAAISFVRRGRGAAAAALLFAAAGVVHWPFFALAMAIFWLALAYSIWASLGSEAVTMGDALRAMTPLGGAAAASMAFTAVTLLGVPAAGGVGVKLFGSGGTPVQVYKVRFIQRLHETSRYWAFPLAAVGALIAGRAPSPPAHRAARRLFLSLMAAWVTISVVAGVVQMYGVPVAGNRLLHYLFPIPLMAGVAVWGLARWLAVRRRSLGPALAFGLVLVVLGGFLFLAWKAGRVQRAWTEAKGVRQIAAADRYVQGFAGDRYVVYLLDTGTGRHHETVGRWWAVVQSTIRPDELERTRFYYGRPAGYLDGFPASALRGGTLVPPEAASRALAVVIDRYNHRGFQEAEALPGARVVAQGVAVLNGPAPPAPLPLPAAVEANTRPIGLALAIVLILFTFLVVGSGWALALLPPDPLVRVGLAPGLGAASMILAGLGWDRVGLPFRGWASLGPVAIASVTGWALALIVAARSVVGVQSGPSASPPGGG